jgi:hypothetical protein
MLYISAVIVAEIRLDIERIAEPGRRTSEGDMLQWRLPIGEGGGTRHDFSQPDLMIGGTALDYGTAVVSSVTSDYEKVRLPAATAWPAAAWL